MRLLLSTLLLCLLACTGTAATRPYLTSGAPAIALRPLGIHTTSLTVEFVNDAGYCGAYILFNATVDGASAIVTVSLDLVDVAGGAVDNQQLCPFLFQYFGEQRFFCAIHNIKPIACRQFGEEECRRRLTERGLHQYHVAYA